MDLGVSPIIVVGKTNAPDKIRICVDVRVPNKALKREHHVTPTVDELIHDLNGRASYISKLDLNAGYQQLELDPESRYITTSRYNLDYMTLQTFKLWDVFRSRNFSECC
ncbi:hypothetical protein HOLleu_15801 [Holothuria leucospilota]|uniref:Reverse transcriptase domain-containing protein n=1 Tax=Holothuria leucospilota TaxID=206669 RepID=A0A9Q1HA65_HOLLE|nr:hypothetical protein HOLleu_15801 [Holothuria leucospilota]